MNRSHLSHELTLFETWQFMYCLRCKQITGTDVNGTLSRVLTIILYALSPNRRVFQRSVLYTSAVIHLSDSLPAYLSVLTLWSRISQEKVGDSVRHYNNNNNPRRYSSDEPWPAEQPPLAVFLDCTRRYWVDMWSAHRIPQLHFQLSKPDRNFFIQVTTQFIRSRGWVDPVPDPTPSEKS
jgi:hypothetical protein